MELLISVAIIALVTTLVLVRHSSFESTVLLKSAAYDIAIALREAQVKSLSQVRSEGSQESFTYSYGLSFVPGNNVYPSFIFKHEEQYPYHDCTISKDINDFTLDRSMQVYDVCIYIGSVENCTVDRLDISFRRPEYKALFFAEGTTDYSTTITSAKIKVNSTRGSGEIFVIDVTNLGQISVSNE